MQGQLFTQDFLLRGVCETPAWAALADADAAALREQLSAIFAGRDAATPLNEAQTESELIWPVLAALGWGDDTLPQVNLSGKRREDVPDLLLFASAADKAQALPLKDDQRLRHGIALLEAKRWLRPLDRGDPSEPQDPDAPSSQMLRYLSRADVVSDRRVKWGVLTNGAVWRLYWQDARSRAEEFFEINLALALGVPGVQGEFDDPEADHALRLFALFFSRSAFLPQAWDTAGRSLHAYARNEARLYEEKVAQDLGQRVFDDIFAQLADALARADLQAQTHSIGYGQFTRPQFTPAYLDEVREAALVLLYRLLFLFYAEDRNLLPVRDARYAAYSLRRIREQVCDRVDAGGAFSGTMTNIWLVLQGVFQLIDEGDDTIGMPAYNGGLFHWGRSPLLGRTKVPDKVMAPIIDALSRRTEDLLKGWINYRDLSVSHLGGIYERLLEYALIHEVQAKDDYKDKPEINRLVAQPASFARKVSGSYYTHDDLVRLVLRESVGLLAKEKMADFEARCAKWAKKAALNPGDWDALDRLDPASALLELKICDPAMGSGHFLVTLVDYLADQVLEAVNAAGQHVAAQAWSAHLVEQNRPWQSPLLGRIAHIRQGIKKNAAAHGWAVADAQLDDRHIVRRMILKKTIFGVDKNPMAVELAKTALWLHTFTVGAPLSFLDHHLKTGDSLHGERFDTVERGLHQLGMLFQQGELQRLKLAAQAIGQVADLTDADMGEVHQSQQLAQEAEAQLAPIHAVLDFWRALRWLIPGWPVAKPAQLGKLLKNQPERQAALARLLDPQVNLMTVLHQGTLPGKDAATQAANQLMAEARALAARETFFHWWTSFPTVFGDGSRGGFDVVLGNPPWDRIKLQQVEWLAERDRAIAAQPRAADRKALIAALQQKNAPLWQAYEQAAERAETQARVVGKGKFGSDDYPLLGGGDVNLYSLFVERAQTLAAPDGMVTLVTPSGIAADKGAAPFFSSLSSHGRLGALFDFENRKVFFPDVHASFKFCVLLFGGPQRRFAQTRCAFFLHSLDELDAQPERTLLLTAEDFARVNPNTGAAPIFRHRRDADITLGLYARHPVLVRHSPQGEQRAWPVKYLRMFDMTNDSAKFLKPEELAADGWQRAPLNRWRKGAQEALPLYEGKMVQMYDHRAADVVVHADNLHRAAQPETLTSATKTAPNRYPHPQFAVNTDEITANPYGWAFGFKEITAPTNARTMIAALMPAVGFGNKLPLLIPQGLDAQAAARVVGLLAATFNCFAFDFVLRQKLQGQTINLFILEQLPVIAPTAFDQLLPAKFAAAARQAALMNGHHPQPTVADFVLPQVLALSYTAHDLAPFARDLGYVDDQDEVLPPIIWDDEARRERLAALDALFFWLYGLNEGDADYVLGQFPIVREQDERAFGRFRTREDVLRWRALLG
ncbi:Eco57I restriction-modification methylase domain-containing protein [Ottowia sp.]|uniref:Eco57I restriction-modification methylase domain-containing protein n=1 Tax=Ottowia sp. TaxID=1898956 RepID=UPI003A873F49